MENRLNQILVYFFLGWCIILMWSLAGMQIMLGSVIFLTLVIHLFRKEQPVKDHPFYLFAGLYILVSLSSLLRSRDIGQTLLSMLNNDWVILTIPLLASLNLSPRWRQRGLNLLILSAVLAAIYGIFQFFTGSDLIRNRALGQFGSYYRAVGAYGSFLSYAGNQLMVLACAYAAFLFPAQSRTVRISYLAAAGIIFLSIIASQSRSSWLALPVIVILGLLTVNRKQLIYISGSLVILVLAVVIFIPDLQSRFMSIFNFAQNETRLNLWRTSAAIISDHPVLGIGSGTFNDYLEIYRVPGFYDARGHAHNDYLNKAVINGLPGLITWIGMWIAWFYYMVRAYKILPQQDEDRKIILGSILAISGILVAALFQCYYTDLENNIVWWFMAAIGLQISIQKVYRPAAE